MAADVFGLPENPFKITPNPRFVYRGKGFDGVLRDLREALQAEREIAIVTARPGMGKTMLLTLLAEELTRDRGPAAAALLNCDTGATAETLFERLWPSPPAVLLLDEAQNLATAELHQFLRLAVAETMPVRMRIVLAGAPVLAALAEDGAPHVVRERIALHRWLEPLPAAEVEPFIAERLQAIGRRRAELFSDAAVEAITRYASGVPRLINSLCATALFLAEFETHRVVSAELVREAARSLEIAPADSAIVPAAPDAPVRGMLVPVASAPGAQEPDEPTFDRAAAAPDRRAQVGVLAAAMATAAVTIAAMLLLGRGTPADSVHRDGAGDDPPSVVGPAEAAMPGPPALAPALVYLVDGGPSSAVERKVDALLARAREQVADLALTTPAADNALKTYQAVLALMPGNPAALRGIHDIGGKYADLSTFARRRGQYAAARIYYKRGIAIAPDHPALLALASRGWTEEVPVARRITHAPRGEISLEAPWTMGGGRR